MHIRKPYHGRMVFLVLAVIYSLLLSMPPAYADPQPTVSAVTASQPGNVHDYILFEDDFSRERNWRDTNADRGRVQDEFQISVSTFYYYYYSKAPVILSTNQYSVEADCRMIKGNEGGYSLVVNIQHNSEEPLEHCYFSILPFEQKYSFDTKTKTGWKRNIAFTASPIIQPGAAVNRLKIVCNGNQVKLFVNNQYLNETTINAYNEKIRVGIAGRSISTAPIIVRFDNFVIKVPKETVKQ